jgi:hypothetical protein
MRTPTGAHTATSDLQTSQTVLRGERLNHSQTVLRGIR